MGFSLGSISSGLSKFGGGVTSLFENPGKWGENVLGEVGLTKQNYQGFQKNVLQNPWVQGGVGLGLSFVPGMQWYAPLAAGYGMELLGGGNLNEQISGAGTAGLGYAAGNLGQSGYAGLQSRFGTKAAGPSGAEIMGSGNPVDTVASQYAPVPDIQPAASTPISSQNMALQYGMEGGAGEYGTLPHQPNTVDIPTTVREAQAYDAAGLAPGPNYTPYAAPQQPSYAPVAEEPSPGARAPGRRVSSGLGGGTAGGRSGGGISLGNVMAAKFGLGALSNLQAQAALEDEMEERERAMGRIRQYQDNPALAYQNDPALRAMRSRALDTVEARSRARTGGTEGGAFAEDIYRTGAAMDRAALNDVLSREYQMLGVTQPAMGYNLQAGGTGLGAVAGPAQGALSDYAFMQLLQDLSQ